jgi:dipeptidyl aminopeptidase/acylaminoacyl peptidase
MPDDASSSGILVLDSQVDIGNGRVSPESFLMNMETHAMTQIAGPDRNLIQFAVSPDRKWLAYRDLKRLFIVSPDNQPRKIYSWKENWGAINWLGNQRLAIGLQQLSEQNDLVKRSSTLLILDAFSGKSEVLSPDFPGIYDLYPLPSWDGWGETAYDSALSRVVYLQGGASGPINYVLWDIKHQQSLAVFEIAGELTTVPRWSPDGQSFAFAPSLLLPIEKWPLYEIYKVSKDGQATQLTHLTDYYPWVYIPDLSWSPDQRFIAFWYSHWAENGEPDFNSHYTQYLAVLDLSNDRVTDYCVVGEPAAEIGLRKNPPPLWSPDSKQLVVQSQYSGSHSQVVLVDIEQGLAFTIGQDLKPEGWLASP